MEYRRIVISPYMKFFSALAHFLFHIGYFGPLLMGILDSSFLVLPFGNDLLVIGMVARHHEGAFWYVLMASCGSTAGACLPFAGIQQAGRRGHSQVCREGPVRKTEESDRSPILHRRRIRRTRSSAIPVHHGDCRRERAGLLPMADSPYQLCGAWRAVRHSRGARIKLWTEYSRDR